MKIGLVGAIDRYNYGDVLFPLVVEENLKKRLSGATFEYYGAIQSNLTQFDAYKTKPMAEIARDGVDALVVVGGETLIATWTATYINTSKNRLFVFFVRVLRKLIGHSQIESLIRRYWRVKNTLPWSFRRSDYGVTKVVYNAVGGASFSRLTDKEKAYLKENLLDASYVSVRDPLTKKNVEALGLADKEVVLSPDSAFIMSDIYPLKELEKKFDSTVPSGDYISFQIGITYVTGNEKVIAEQLHRILNETPLDVLLVPIGRVPMHEDDRALQKLLAVYEQLFGKTERVTYLEAPGIFQTMYAIANSRLFIGTSLHGNITALSYAKPSMSIGSIDKLAGFLREYSVPSQQVNVPYADIYEATKKSLNIPQEELQKNATRIKGLIDANFTRLADELAR